MTDSWATQPASVHFEIVLYLHFLKATYKLNYEFEMKCKTKPNQTQKVSEKEELRHEAAGQAGIIETGVSCGS